MTIFCSTLSVLILLFAVASDAFSTLPPTSVRTYYARICSTLSSSASSDEIERLKKSASRLREEAEALRKDLDESSPSRRTSSQPTSPPSPPIVYTSLSDSTWTFSYRFSNEPTSDNDDNESDKNDDKQLPRINYSGKLTVTFRSDGYTDLVSHEPTGSGTPLNIEKVWGWDEEQSKEDDETYVLFSMSTFNDSKQERFYWQARVNTNNRGEISLADGTVTVKRDVKPPGGFWGVFDGGGILAQFRYVGNFGGKPIRAAGEK